MKSCNEGICWSKSVHEAENEGCTSYSYESSVLDNDDNREEAYNHYRKSRDNGDFCRMQIRTKTDMNVRIVI